MKSMIALFALLAVAAATDFQQWSGVNHQKNQRYGVAGYGSGLTGYGIGYPSTYGSQIYGQSYYNPITYGQYGARPVSDYTYGYNTPAYTYGSASYGLGRVGSFDHVGAYGAGRQVGAYGVQPISYNTYSSVQPIVSKTYTTGHISQPAFTSYYNRGAENLVKPEITHVADLSYKTVQQPIVDTIAYKPVVQQPIVSDFAYKTVQQPIVDTVAYKPVVQQPIVSEYTYKTVQQPIVASYVTPQLQHQGAYVQQQQQYQYQQPQYVEGQVGQLNYGNYETVPKYANYETVPKVSSFSYSSQNAHVVEPKQVGQSTYTATGEADYKK
jgi:hypothetical protein